MFKLISILLLVLFTFGCNQTTKESSTLTKVKIPIEPMIIEKPEPEIFATNEQIAKAAISALFYQPTNIMSASTDGDIILVSYARPDDGKKFDYKVLIANNNISWGNSVGKWRDSTYDEKLSYSVTRQELIITTTYDDGSKSQERFNIEDL